MNDDIQTGKRQPRRSIQLLGLVFVLIALSGGAAIAGFFYQQQAATQYYQQGKQLAGTGACAEAVTAYNNALAIWPGAARQYDMATYLGRGACYVTLGEYEAAIADLDTVLGANPADIQARQLHLEARLALTQTQAALSEIEDLMALQGPTPSLLLERAHLYYQQNNYVQAVINSQQAISLDDTFLEAYLLKSISSLYSQQYETALGAAESALTLSDEAGAAYAYRGAARYFTYQDDEQVEADLVQAIALAPDLTASHTFLARFFLNQDNITATLTAAEQAITQGDETDPAVALAYATRGVAHLQRENFEAAEADIEQAIALNSHLPQVWLAQANLNLSQEDYEAALANIHTALTLAPELASAYHWRAEVYLTLDYLEAALADINRSLALAPKQAAAYATRGWIYILQEEPELALADFNQTLEMDAENPFFYAGRGSVYLLEDDYAAAQSDFEEAVSADPTNPFYHFLQAENYFYRDDYTLASKEYWQAINLGLEDLEAYATLIDIYLGQAAYQDALSTAETFVTLAQETTDERWLPISYVQRARVHLALEAPDQFLADINQAIELKPDLAWAYYLRGQFQLGKEDLEAALSDLNQAINLDSGFVEAYVSRAEAYLHQNDYPAAIQNSSLALRLDADFRPAYMTRAFAYAVLDDVPAAIADYTQAINLNETDPYAYAWRGEMLAYQEDYEPALEDVNKALELSPDLLDGYINRGFIHFSMDDYEAAVTDYTQAIRLDATNVLAYRGRGIAYQALEDYVAAIADFEQVIDLAPDEARGYILRANSYLELNDQPNGIADLETALSLSQAVDEIAAVESELVRLTTPLPGSLASATSYLRYNETQGHYSFSYPSHWSVFTEDEAVYTSGRDPDEPVITLVALDIPEEAYLEELMLIFKREYAREQSGYSAIGDSALTINDLPALKHTFRLSSSPDFGNRSVIGVAVLVRRGRNVIFITAFAPETLYSVQSALINQIVSSVVVN